MAEYVCADWLTPEALRALLDSPPAIFRWAILEPVNKVVFQPFNPQEQETLSDVGRVFGPECEIRWHRDGEQFHTLLMGNFLQPPSIFTAHQQVLSETEFNRVEREYFLWGEWSIEVPEWVEARIPQVFSYPQPSRPGRWRYKLLTVEYINQQTGEMEFYRFTGTREVLL